jgi:hypothetical protein
MTHVSRPTIQIALILMIGLTGAGRARAASDQLVMTINGTPYSHRQLFGMDAKELRSQFDSAVKNYTDESLHSYLESSGYLRRHPEAKASLATRQELESAVFESADQAMLDFACRHLVLAHLGDEILRRHQAKAADFFNLDALNAALARQIGLIDFLYDHQAEPATRNEALYVEANEKLGLAISKDAWPTLREMVRKRPVWMRWGAVALRRSEQVDRYVLRAVLAHYLLQAACAEGGVYYERAKTEVQFGRSELYRIRVSGYVGSPDVLQEYLNSVVDKDGDVALQGVQQLQLWFNGAGMTAHMQVDRAIGGMLGDGASVPALGALSRINPDTFEMVGWARKRELEGTTDNDKKALAIFWQSRAYKMAVADFLPEVKSAIGTWQPNIALLAEAVSVEGKSLVLPEVKVAEFIRRPYPAKPFEEFERQRVALQEMAVRAALVARKHDSKAGAQLEQELAQRIGGSETEAVRSAYQALASRLSTELASGRPTQ